MELETTSNGGPTSLPASSRHSAADRYPSRALSKENRDHADQALNGACRANSRLYKAASILFSSRQHYRTLCSRRLVHICHQFRVRRQHGFLETLVIGNAPLAPFR